MADAATHRPQQRPRTSSMLSWGSHKSKDSAGKTDLTESEKDKAQRRIKGKADPSVAINELQPSAQAQEKSTIASLRSMQFRDRKGDLITDPDRSNPTRYRFERPLDTIRSFEAAIESGYSRRYTIHPAFNSPRTPGHNPNSYFDQTPGSRPESVYDPQQQPGGYAYPGAQTNNGWQGSHPSRRQPHGRMNSEPIYNTHPHANANNAPPPHSQGYDSGTASSSGTYQTEQSNGSTNPSSFNGSNGNVNQMNSVPRPQPPAHQETYGIEFQPQQQYEPSQQLNHYGHDQMSPNEYEAGGMSDHGRQYNDNQNAGYGPAANASGMPPPPPPHANAVGGMRKPIGDGNQYPRPMNKSYNQSSSSPLSEPPKTEKRKSWLARRFSKQG